MITEFRRKYFFLSNFYSCPITFQGHHYKNAEAAFHAQKDITRTKEFEALDPSQAKRLGRRVTLRKDWEAVKYGISEFLG